MTRDELFVTLEGKVKNLGADHAAVIDASEIVLDARFRTMCEANSCGVYGKCWMCPPDAGEIGAGHCVTALYEIIPTGNQTDSELLTVAVRYKEPLGDTSTQYDTSILASEYTASPSDNFIFASNIAGMAMLLRDSAYNENYNLEAFADYLKNADISGDLYREELRDYIIPAVFDYLDDSVIDEVVIYD